MVNSSIRLSFPRINILKTMTHVSFPVRLALIMSLAGSAFSVSAQDQPVRLNLYGGYTFADKFNFSGYVGYDQAKIDEAAHFGAGLEFEFKPRTALEIYYQQQNTTGRLLGALNDVSTDVNVSYIMLGGMQYAGNDRIKGYGGLLVGAAIFNSDEASSTKLGIGGRLGLLITPNERIGIRLGAQLLSAVQGVGGGFYFGTGGAGAGVSTYSSLYQFGFFGGIALTLGGSNSPRPASTVAPPAPAPTPAPGTPPPPPPPQPR